MQLLFGEPFGTMSVVFEGFNVYNFLRTPKISPRTQFLLYLL